MSERELDLVVYGATGFTGALVAEYLLATYGVGRELHWAIAGRNPEKLETLLQTLTQQDAAAHDIPVVVADSSSPTDVKALAERTAVVATTVGPYARYGSELVAACADRGTHYCDLTGEVVWMQRMIETHEDRALETGARIVHTCGFDSIPSDLGVLFVQEEMQARHGVPAKHVKYRVKGFSGGASGGTVASMLEMMEEAERDPSVMLQMDDPYALNPKDQRTGPDAAEGLSPSYDDDFEEWIAPFIMAGINTKVVRRSNALLEYAYGKDFRYDEGVLTGAGPLGLARATATAAGTGAMNRAMRWGALRRAVSGYLPQPGDGPSPETREAGYFDIVLLGIHPSDPAKHLRARVTGDRDPGYGSTAKMLGEAGVCLAKDPLESAPGFSTPAAAMGRRLIDRLCASAGLTFEVVE